MFSRRISKVLAVLVFAALLPAQQGTNCPDQVVTPAGGYGTPGPLQKCSTGIQVKLPSVSLTLPVNTCPLWVVFEPARDVPKSQPGSHTYAQAVRQVGVVRTSYYCKADYFLFFFLGATCVEGRSATIGTRSHYEQKPCVDPER